MKQKENGIEVQMIVNTILFNNVLTKKMLMKETKKLIEQNAEIKQYNIAKVINISKEEYEDLIQSFRSERKYITDNIRLCKENNSVLLVKQEDDDEKEPIIIQPMAYRYAKQVGLIVEKIPLSEYIIQERDNPKVQDIIKYAIENDRVAKTMRIKMEIIVDPNKPHKRIVVG